MQAKEHFGPLADKGELAFDGFKEELTKGQNGWAIVHIQGVAGALLAGHEAAQKQIAEDKHSLKLGLDAKADGRTTIPYAGRLKNTHSTNTSKKNKRRSQTTKRVYLLPPFWKGLLMGERMLSLLE